MTPSNGRRLLIGALTAASLALLPTSAPAASSSIRSCGNATSSGVLIGDITARRASCKTARKVARAVPRRCGESGSCTVRGYSCLTAEATDELSFARCSKSGKGEELYRTIRFDFGS